MVEAKELTEEEILQESERWESGRIEQAKSLESEEETIEFYDGSMKSETIKSYQQLKQKLNETNLKLVRSREAYWKARAEKAESLLETYSRTRSSTSNSTSDNINTNNKQKIPIIVFEDKEDDEEENTELLEDDEEDDSIVQLSLSSQISMISERAERLSIMRISVANKESSSSGDDSLDDDKIDDIFQDLDDDNKEKEVQTFPDEFKGDG